MMQLYIKCIAIIFIVPGFSSKGTFYIRDVQNTPVILLNVLFITLMVTRHQSNAHLQMGLALDYDKVFVAYHISWNAYLVGLCFAKRPQK